MSASKIYDWGFHLGVIGATIGVLGGLSCIIAGGLIGYGLGILFVVASERDP